MPQPEPVAPLYRRRAFFVYYQVARSQADRLQVAFAAAASTASAPLPWQAELMRRAEPSGPSAAAGAPPAAGNDLQTWMEVYWLADGLDAAAGAGRDEMGAATRQAQAPVEGWDPSPLRQLIEARAGAAGILDLVHGERHYEAFESCA